MRRKKLFIYIVLTAVLLSAALGIGAKTIHERIINGKEPADNHTTAPLVDVDVTKGQPGEKIKNPLPEWNTLINGSYDEEGKDIPQNDGKGQNGPPDAREGHGTSEENPAAGDIFTENGREVVHFDYCKDGDTIVVTKGSGESVTVRLIGINTPESVAPEEYTQKTGKENNDYGKSASGHAKELFKNTDILYLEYDTEKTDPYGRTLAYVYFSDTGSLTDTANAKMLEDGYASVMSIAPNTKYAAEFQSIQDAARQNKAGLWQYEDFYNNYQTY